MQAPRSRALRALLAAALLLGPGLGCVGVGPAQAPRYGWFVPPAATDPWSAKITAWQARERALPAAARLRSPAEVSGPGEAPSGARAAPDLRAKYFAYRAERKRAMARELADWIQREARTHYVPDGPVDHWATFTETLVRNGDDCDGLELLAYHFLRDLGFGEQEVYRAIVHRPADGQHHMVTLWFEQPEDPWVIDPTGAMTSGMPRMSEVPGWVPLKVFSETEEFTVQPRTAALAAPPPR